MKLLTKETDYAVRAVIHLARNKGRLVSSREISTEQAIPLQFLRRILQRLARAGLVASKEGVAGGVALAVKPSNIELVDVIKVFQGEVELSGCMFRARICANRSTCVLRRRIKAIERRVVSELESISIADLVEDMEAGK